MHATPNLATVVATNFRMRIWGLCAAHGLLGAAVGDTSGPEYGAQLLLDAVRAAIRDMQVLCGCPTAHLAHTSLKGWRAG